MVRDRFFYFLDLLLPRFLAKLPYQFAELYLRRKLKRIFSQSELWIRNSVMLDSYVFGVSDLDLTIFSNEELDELHIKQFLINGKRQFPFLGEANCYLEKDLPLVNATINYFELKRDQFLLSKFVKNEVDREVETVVFLLRTLMADKKTLKGDEKIRIKKWSEHFLSLGLTENFIDKRTVVKVISSYFTDSENIKLVLNNWLDSSPWRDDLFHDDFGAKWKIIYPHKYLWFEHDRNELPLALTDFEQKIILRQVDWELWGLYTQRYFLQRESVEIHLQRLKKMLIHFNLNQKNLNQMFKRILEVRK